MNIIAYNRLSHHKLNIIGCLWGGIYKWLKQGPLCLWQIINYHTVFWYLMNMFHFMQLRYDYSKLYIVPMCLFSQAQ